VQRYAAVIPGRCARLESSGFARGWPTTELDLNVIDSLGGTQTTSHQAFERVLASVGAIPHDSDDLPVRQFFELDQATTARGDVAMRQSQHVRAWLATAFGNLLASIALSPQSPHDQLVVETRRRLLIPRSLKAAPMWGVPFEEGELGLLYNCRQNPQGTRLRWRGMRVGQGEEWMKHWGWLSSFLQVEHTLPAVHLAARLMRCRSSTLRWLSFGVGCCRSQ
jgi:hypothetical protein